jgi:hypothetical protein
MGQKATHSKSSPHTNELREKSNSDVNRRIPLPIANVVSRISYNGRLTTDSSKNIPIDECSKWLDIQAEDKKPYKTIYHMFSSNSRHPHPPVYQLEAFLNCPSKMVRNPSGKSHGTSGYTTGYLLHNPGKLPPKKVQREAHQTMPWMTCLLKKNWRGPQTLMHT